MLDMLLLMVENQIFIFIWIPNEFADGMTVCQWVPSSFISAKS